jgi:hypothetical protein
MGEVKKWLELLSRDHIRLKVWHFWLLMAEGALIGFGIGAVIYTK